MADPRLRDYFINPFQTFGLGTNPFSMGATKEEEHLVNLRNKHEKGDPKWVTINNEILAVQRDAQKAAFQGAQKGAPQSYTGKLGEPFGMSKYKSTAMFPSKSMPVSDPARLQANPVGYDKEPWWRQSPYVSPRQPGYSIFSMKPYSW
tara:strand:+ start:218 stop:661 length:444 start_codon:yes stop_codon:yes gene_type:complete